MGLGSSEDVLTFILVVCAKNHLEENTMQIQTKNEKQLFSFYAFFKV